MTLSARLGAPYLAAAQIDKSTTHNEAVTLFDIAVSAAVDGFLVNSPPASPAAGNCYIIGNAPSGAWAGQAQALAGFTAGGWRFIAPVEGLAVVEKASGETAIFRSGAWEKGNVRAQKMLVGGNQVVGPQLPAIPDPAGGANVDSEARAALAAILARLRTHGLIAS